jgi:hypothetical protein
MDATARKRDFLNREKDDGAAQTPLATVTLSDEQRDHPGRTTVAFA